MRSHQLSRRIDHASVGLARCFGQSRHGILQLAHRFVAPLGRKLLTRDETAASLAADGLQWKPDEVITFTASGEKPLEVLQSGVLRLPDGRCLAFDYGSRAALWGWIGRATHVPAAALLWSHFWTGYYHWVIDVLPKVLLLQKSLGDAFAETTLCYPFFEEPYEAETLEMLGVRSSQLLNTREFRLVTTRTAHAVPLPGWYRIPRAALLLRETLLAQAPAAPHAAGERIYVARAGRRKCVNEQAVFALLERHGFTFLEDRPRTVAEQIAIFRGAKIIVAPHGAALTNLLWCQPGTTVVEFFSPYYRPTYYQELASLVSASYHALVTPPNLGDHWTAASRDIEVEVPVLDQLLQKILASQK